MAWDHIPGQDYYFYAGKWKQPYDEHLIRRLLAKKDEVFPTLPHKSPHVLIDMLDAFNDDLHTNFRLLDLTQRLEFLEQCFHTFKDLANMPETHYDSATNQLHAVNEVWAKILEKTWLAQAYVRAGEPEYNEMCMLFAPNEIKTEISRTLILISDSPVGKKNSPINLISASSPEDEVNSHVPPPPKRVVRKLSYEADDAMSSVAPIRKITPHYYVPWPKLESRLRFSTVDDVPASGEKAKAKNDADNSHVGGHSSCTSSSLF